MMRIAVRLTPFCRKLGRWRATIFFRSARRASSNKVGLVRFTFTNFFPTSLPLCVDAFVMSYPSTPDTAFLSASSDINIPNLSNPLASGVVGLFVQGLETGLVLAQLSSWLSFPEYTESLLVIILTVFVTTVG